MADSYNQSDSRTYSSLDELEPENISSGSTDRLEFVLERLSEANSLENDLVWQSEIWNDVTVEELLGALIEADRLLEHYNEIRYAEDGMKYECDYRIKE